MKRTSLCAISESVEIVVKIVTVRRNRMSVTGRADAW